MFGSRPPLAVPPAESPSTRKISESAGIRRLAVDQLAGQTAPLEHVLAARQIARLLGGFARALRLHALLDDRARDLRVLLEEEIEPFGDERVHDRPDLRVAELGLRLTFELRVLKLHRDDRGEPFHAIVGREVRLGFFEHSALARVLVDLAGDRGAEAGQVHPAFDRVDVVRVRVDDFVVAVLPLQRALDVDAVALAVGRDDRRERFLVLVEPLDERDDSALVHVAALARTLVRALVAQDDRETAVQERQLAQPRLEDLPREVEGLEDLRIGLEMLDRAGALGAVRAVLSFCEVTPRSNRIS